MKDAIAYSGTMSMIRITCLHARLQQTTLQTYAGMKDAPLKMRLPIVLEMEDDGHGRDSRGNDGTKAGGEEDGNGEGRPRASAKLGFCHGCFLLSTASTTQI